MIGPYLTLCTSEEEYAAVCKHLKIEPDDYHGSDDANGTTHIFENAKDDMVCAVCVDPTDDVPAMCGLLVHEAVHVWEAHCRSIGDKNPSEESTAYGVQHIAYQLIDEYMSRVKKGAK
jgi:hypothetical protein